MSPILIRTLLALCVLALPVTAAACGDDDSSDEDPQAILEETFGGEGSITSGELDVSINLSAEGRRGGSIEATITGPFQGEPDDPTAIPQFDLDVAATGDLLGDTLDFARGATITEDNAYLEVRGQAYEVGAARFARIQEALGAQTESAESAEESSASITELCAQALEPAGLDTTACEIDLTSWLTNLTNEGTEEIAGAEVVHIAGDADVQQILTDVGALVGAFAGGLLEGLDPSALGSLSELVSEAAVDVYSGVDDRLLRGLDVDMVIDLSALSGLGARLPIDTINAVLEAEISGVNEEQTIEPPPDPRPYEDLPRGFGLGFELDFGGQTLFGPR